MVPDQILAELHIGSYLTASIANAGINCAPTAAAAYLWRHRGFSLNGAIVWIKAWRTCEPEFLVLMRYV